MDKEIGDMTADEIFSLDEDVFCKYLDNSEYSKTISKMVFRQGNLYNKLRKHYEKECYENFHSLLNIQKNLKDGALIMCRDCNSLMKLTGGVFYSCKKCNLIAEISYREPQEIKIFKTNKNGKR